MWKNFLLQLEKIRTLFPYEQRWKLNILLFSMVIVALVEMAGVGLVMPYITLFDNGDILRSNEYVASLSSLLNISDLKQFIIFCSVALVAFYIIKNIFMGLILYWQSSFLAQSEASVATSLLKSYLSMPYIKFVNRNSAELVNNITVETSLLFAGLIKPVFIIISDTLIVICVVMLLFIVAPVATMVAIGGVGMTAGIFYFALRTPVKNLGNSRQFHKEKMAQWVNQSIGSMKELIVLQRKDFFAGSFNNHAKEMVVAQKFYETVIQLPRLVIESAAVVILVLVSLVLMEGQESLLPKLSLFAMAAFRIMPAMNRITTCMTKVKYYTKTLDNIFDDLDHKLDSKEENSVLTFKEKIQLSDISYSYLDGKIVLNGVNITIAKGDSVGIIGESGAGKSTLIDILLGLLKPNSGQVLVDGENIAKSLSSWRSHISYMPQTIYLTDDTIRCNVALGVAENNIDDEWVMACLEKAELKDLVESLSDGINTKVGDRGARLSGGQRQRIGIARALYNKPDILVLDEATTGLDPKTEKRVCDTLQNLSKELTIIAISHQSALTEIASHVYELDGGKLTLIGE